MSSLSNSTELNNSNNLSNSLDIPFDEETETNQKQSDKDDITKELNEYVELNEINKFNQINQNAQNQMPLKTPRNIVNGQTINVLNFQKKNIDKLYGWCVYRENQKETDKPFVKEAMQFVSEKYLPNMLNDPENPMSMYMAETDPEVLFNRSLSTDTLASISPVTKT